VEGLLVPAGDIDRLAEGMERLGTDPSLRAALALAARRRAEEFDWLRYHAALQDAVIDLVRPGSAGVAPRHPGKDGGPT
jgi:glycosyltransferase involved in cell wall biosynthesis